MKVPPTKISPLPFSSPWSTRRFPVSPAGGLNSRRGRIEGMESENGESRIKGFVPLSEMFGYATGLRSATQGRGTFTMTFDHYEEVPKAISQQITEERLGKK